MATAESPMRAAPLTPEAFIQEIDYEEMKSFETIGRGTFGTVKRANWRGKLVAVKVIETESERKAFRVEVLQLSRVKHDNIVKLYGACTKSPVTCLVMEYAEGGSLYSVLHGTPAPRYTAAHAISWCLQCALGVEYLHGMKPKGLIHRDLKPPNLLLVMGGTVLKICDFGTACENQTYMTNNKGSAAWMAPEVFRGVKYSEKCDIFSWGIILWEVLTRRKPFDEIGGSAFRIMWAVHEGTRPPLVAGLPKILESLMVSCWDGEPSDRPSMSEVVQTMVFMSRFLEGADQPIVYPKEEAGKDVEEVIYESPLSTEQDLHSTVLDSGQIIPWIKRDKPFHPTVIEEGASGFSAPGSLAGSRDNLIDAPKENVAHIDDKTVKRKSADLSNLDHQSILMQGSSNKPVQGHRRTKSSESGSLNLSRESTPVGQSVRQENVGFQGRLGPKVGDVQSGSHVPYYQGQHGSSRLKSSISTPGQIMHVADAQKLPETSEFDRSVSVPRGMVSAQTNVPALPQAGIWPVSVAYAALNPQLQPFPPNPKCPESVQVFKEHCVFAEEYMKLQTEIEVLTSRREQLEGELNQELTKEEQQARISREYAELIDENASLREFYENLKKQLDGIRSKRMQQQQLQHGSG